MFRPWISTCIHNVCPRSKHFVFVMNFNKKGTSNGPGESPDAQGKSLTCTPVEDGEGKSLYDIMVPSTKGVTNVDTSTGMYYLMVYLWPILGIIIGLIIIAIIGYIIRKSTNRGNNTGSVTGVGNGWGNNKKYS